MVNKRQKKKFKKKLYHKTYRGLKDYACYETVLLAFDKITRNGRVYKAPLPNHIIPTIKTSLSKIESLRPKDLTELETGRPWWCGGIIKETEE